MVTILLQTIIELLTGWKDSFFTWANEVGDKIAAIKTNTDSLPGIKADTADIKDNTAAIITPISNINTNVSAITPDVASIKADTLVIKNNANAIMTSSGQTAAYAEDIADNTLDCSNRLVTIGSDTTQIRADSGSLAANVSEIKNTLGLYLYNTIVTEDAEGTIANFDTDLKDYLQNAVVTIPAIGAGVSGLLIVNQLTDKSSAICFHGLLDGSYMYIDMSSLGWVMGSSGNVNYFTVSIPNKAFGALNLITNKYDITDAVSVTNMPNETIKGVANNRSIFVRDDNFSDATTFKNSLSGYYLIYELSSVITPTISKSQFEALSSDFGIDLNDYVVSFTAPITDGAEADLLSGIVKINTSPVTYDSITPLAIRTFKGVNNIYSDIGDMSVTYRETLKYYLEKQDNNSRSLNRNVNLLRENIESNEDSDRREI